VTISTAVIAGIGKAETFEHGRDLAAWLGLVPRQSTTGGKARQRATLWTAGIGPSPPGGQETPSTCWSVCRARLEKIYGSDPRSALVEPDSQSGSVWRSTADLRRLFPRNASKTGRDRKQSRACPVTACLMVNDHPLGCLESFFTGDLGIPERVRLLRIGLTGRPETYAS